MSRARERMETKTVGLMHKTLFLFCIGSLVTACAEEKKVVKVEAPAPVTVVQPEEIYNQAIEDLAAGRGQQARERFEEAIAKWHKKENPGPLAEAHYNLGVMDLRQGNLDQARARFEKCLALLPEHRDALVNLGVVLREKKDLAGAIAHYQEALRRIPRDPILMNNLIVVYRLNKQYKEAEKIGHDLLARAPNNVEAYKNMTLIYYDQGKYKMAELLCINAGKMLEKLRAKDPSIKDDAGIYSNLGMIYMKQDRVREALAQFEKALSVDPNHRDALLNIGAIAHKYRDYNRCLAVYSKVLEQDPKDKAALRGMAYATFGMGKAKESIEAMQNLLREIPGESRALFLLGEIYYNNLKDYAQAVSHYERYMQAMGSALASSDPVHDRLKAARAKLQMAAELKKEEEETRIKEEQRKQALEKAKAESEQEKKEAQDKLKEMLKDETAGQPPPAGQGTAPPPAPGGEQPPSDEKQVQPGTEPRDDQPAAPSGGETTKPGEEKAPPSPETEAGAGENKAPAEATPEEKSPGTATGGGEEKP